MADGFEVPTETVDKAIELGRLLLAFGLVNRATHHPDGVTLESDTDHTVMLGIMAPAFAERFVPNLDRGLIAQYALVHDLVEVYASDTPTFGLMDDAHLKDKDAREAAALIRIKNEFGATFPWIPETIEAYESLATPEARYVKVFDKVLPKIVHILNRGVTVRSLGGTYQSTKDFHAYQLAKLAGSYGSDQSEAIEMLRIVNELSDDLVAEVEPSWSTEK